ncbi:MAG: DNA primase [Candidatus Latescibacterota bacterium]|nr:MAG: DNA primase [Candidatus Latescibacterota bacterium]
MQIPEETINEIRERADIVEVVSQFVELRRSGSNFKGLCPFHEEKTPSFNVNPDRQIFHCFGCGRGGNVYTFLMEIEGISFPEAVRALGRQYGVEVVTREVPEEVRSRNEALYRANEFACQLYQRNLVDKRKGERARQYLLSRGIPKEAWTGFRIGYASDTWDQLVAAARKKKYSIDVLRTLKLVVSSDNSVGYYDYFRNRLMFPILSLSRRVVAFGARTLETDAEPKYLNSAESPIYAKRKTLFGLDRARDSIRERRSVIMVEGYTDCIAMHVKGFGNTVASCGTAITPDHAALLRRVSQRVVLIPDADPAGFDSALSSGAVFLAAGLDVQVVRLETGTDPDTAVNALGAEKFGKILGGALDYLQFLDYIMKDRPMSPREKESVIHRVTAGLADFGDRLRYEVVVQDIAGILGVDPETLRERRKPRATRDTTSDGLETRPSRDAARRVDLEKTLLRLLLEDTPEAVEAREKLDSDDFSHDRSREFYKLLDSTWGNHIDIESHAFHKRAEGAGLEGFAAEVALIPIPPGNLGRLLNDTLRRVKELRIRDELDVLREKLQELPEDSDEAVALAGHYARLKRALSEL